MYFAAEFAEGIKPLLPVGFTVFVAGAGVVLFRWLVGRRLDPPGPRGNLSRVWCTACVWEVDGPHTIEEVETLVNSHYCASGRWLA